MDTKIEIPSEVVAIINQKEIEIAEEDQKEKEQKEREQQELEMKGKRLVADHLTKALSMVPAWLHNYFYVFKEREPDYIRLACGYGSVEDIDLYFTIPGLTEIRFDPKKKLWMEASARWNSYDGDCAPYTSFYDNSWNQTIEKTLVLAKKEFAQHQENLIKKQQQQEQEAQARSARALENQIEEANSQEEKVQADLKLQQRNTEEQALFDAIKNDPVMLTMLKAMVIIHEERNSFAERINEADQNAFWAEERWERRAMELRNQAEREQRRAEEEKSRLQNDLDDAEAKLRKAEKAQRGY